MASILKVDEMQGVTSAGDITITSEGGSATQSLQQGLAKAWLDFDGSDNSTDDSLNIASVTDSGTGSFYPNISNNLSSVNYAVSGNASWTSNAGAGGVMSIGAGTAKTTSQTRCFIYGSDGNSSSYDALDVMPVWHGDLA
jgi:hypothetical protein